MSISIEFSDGKGDRTEGFDVASNLGWSEFGEWVDALPVGGGFDSVLQVWEYGKTFRGKTLAKELRAALEKTDPAPEVRSVAENLAALVELHTVDGGVFVSDDS